jgi:hypothetical protein
MGRGAQDASRKTALELRGNMLPEQPKTLITRSATVDLTAFVKLAYTLIGFATLAYFFFSRFDTGGTFASAAEHASMGLMYGVMGLILVFGVVVVGVSLRAPKH